jgi:hypothetical protein
MPDEKETQAGECFSMSRVAHVLERTGLGMVGAMCGTFLAAYFSRAGIEGFTSIGFVALVVLIGSIAFYLGINIPGLRADARKHGVKRGMPSWDPVQLLSAAGTFLAAMAGLGAVYALIFDEPPKPLWEFVIGSWWVIGVTMQSSAGIMGRLRVSRTSLPGIPSGDTVAQGISGEEAAI